ncbi:MAG: protein translocase subunit SecF [Gammaproteobacteria bacterium]|nr:protein translocase subunit SecF [Gammaproteobacteria bacterium]
MKPLRFVPDNTKIAFMKFARPGFYASVAAVLLSVGLFFAIGLNYGIDFKGGTLIEIRTEQPADLNELRTTIGGLGLGGSELQEFGDPRDVLIRIETQAGGEEAQQKAIATVKEALGPNVDYRRVEVVGPTVSSELARDGILAILLSFVAIMIYIWLRFEWQFAIGTVATLVHDVALTVGLFAILQLQFDLTIIAALLTIVGYSLNDTVVVFDRFRENLRKYKKMNFDEMVDMSLNQTLPRTLMTSISTLVALISLYVFGGEVLRGFTFAMIWGVVIGTYSSIFIGSPLLSLLGAYVDRAPTPGPGDNAQADAEIVQP